MHLPGSIREAVRQALAEELGLPDLDLQGTPMAGGDVCHAARIRAAGRDYFLKWREDAPPGFFAAEADGLRRLARVHSQGASGAGIPAVIAAGPSFLLLEWIEPAPRGQEALARQLGRALARQHEATGPAFGLERETFLGPLRFPPGRGEDWPRYYRDRRLAVLVELAGRQGRLDALRARRLHRLLDRLEEWLGHRPRPSLLHGDLWGGNWIAGCGTGGAGGPGDGKAGGIPEAESGAAVPTAAGAMRPYLIDPAAFYGDGELDLAMAALFGGFPPAFFAAYAAERPLPAGYEERRPLYQLYYLLAHLVLFGESYGPAVDRILRRYVG